MNIADFSKNSQDYLSRLMMSSHFDLNDPETFKKIDEPYKLGDTYYQIYIFNSLTGYLPDKTKEDEPVLYTFYILEPVGEIKDSFVNEVQKQIRGESYNAEVIGNYYANLTLGFKPFDTLSYSLGKMLEETFFPGKGYKFTFHTSCLTRGFDFALVYLQLNSLDSFQHRYPGDAILPFNV